MHVCVYIYCIYICGTTSTSSTTSSSLTSLSRYIYAQDYIHDMNKYMYIYIYVYLYICIYIYMYMYIHASRLHTRYMHVYAYRVHVCLCLHMCITASTLSTISSFPSNLNTYIHDVHIDDIYIDVYTSVPVHDLCIDMYQKMCVYIHAYVYIYM